MQAFVSYLTPQKRTAVLIVDLNMHTGGMAKAFIDFPNANPLLYYLGFNHADGAWAECHLQDYLAEKLLSGAVVVPGVTLPSAELPAELLASELERPRLSRLVWNDAVKVHVLATLKMPEAVLRKWHDHPTSPTASRSSTRTPSPPASSMWTLTSSSPFHPSSAA